MSGSYNKPVSLFTLTTRERETPPHVVPPLGGPGGADRVNAELQTAEGTQIQIAGGKILEVKAAGTAPGTSVEVRHSVATTGAG